MDWNTVWNMITSWVMNVGIKIVISVIILIVGFKLINFVIKKLEKRSEHNEKIDKTITRTLLYVAKIALKCLLAVCIVGYLGIDTSSITALIASLGVCVGLAVNGALGNIAGGVLILVTRPFRVDDYIEVAGYSGTVEDIHLCYTKLITVDNKVVYIPNGTASGAAVVNYSEKDTRRVDLEFEISEENSFEEAEKILNKILSENDKVLHDKDKTVRVCGSTDNGIIICCRSWVKKADYWDVFYDVREKAKKAFDEAHIEFPYKQMDVRVVDKRDRKER